MTRGLLVEGVEQFEKYMRISRKASGLRQERMRSLIDERLPGLKRRSETKVLEDAMEFSHLLGIARGIGAISDAQCEYIACILAGKRPLTPA